MATALDIIKAALRRITSYQSGETIAAPDQQDCLDTLNDMLDSWSTDKLQIFGTNENILQWVNGQAQYKVGNPTCTSIGEAPFTGTLTGASPAITGVTNIPSDLQIGATLTDTANCIPAGTTVIAIGASSVTMSANASATPSTGTDTITYTIPGDFAIPRPLRITGGFTRINQLDFWLDVYTTQEEYTSVLYKAQPGPWPVIAWYNPQMPYGILNVYQTPANSGTLHLFTDTILGNLTMNQTFVMPQGYARAIKWNLAKELCSEYGFPLSDAIKVNAAESLKMIKALNEQPAMRSSYDRALLRGPKVGADWITHGGYGR
jgi:hypothetical protein